MGSNRKLPSKREIRAFWATKLVEIGKFDSVKEATEADYCFACGFQYPTVRAHILARVGRDDRDTIDNLHLLRDVCHTDSEYLNGKEYWEWLTTRSLWDRQASSLLRHGVNFSDLQRGLTGDAAAAARIAARMGGTTRLHQKGTRPSTRDTCT